MNKTQWNNPGGKPVTQDDFNFMQSAQIEMFSAIASMLPGFIGSTTAFVLSGCDVYLNGGTGTYWNRAGYVAINWVGAMEIYRVPEGNLNVADMTGVTLSFRINDVSTYPDPDVFANGVARNTHRTRTAQMNTLNQGPAAYDPNFNLVQNIGNALNAITWHTVGAGGQPSFQGPNWSAPTNAVRYGKSLTGVVYIQGIARSTVISGPTPTIFTLPAGFRPGQDLTFSINRLVLSGTDIFASSVTVGTNGIVTVDTGSLYVGYDYFLALPSFPAEN